MEGSQTGVPLYKKHGFESIRDVEVKPVKEEGEKSEEWKALDGELVEVLTVMRRPCKKDFDDGDSSIVEIEKDRRRMPKAQGIFSTHIEYLH